MKKLLYLLGATVLAFGLTACNDDDKENPNDELVKAAAGTYTTNLKIGEEIIENATITIAKETDQTVTFRMNGLQIENESIDVNVSGVAVSGTTSAVAVAYDGKTASSSENTVKIACTVKGNDISGTMDFKIGEDTYRVSLTDEKPGTVDEDLASDVAGTYDVVLNIDMGEEVTIDAKIIIAKVSDTKVSLTLDGFVFPEFGEIPIKIDEINLGGTIGNVTISESNLTTTTEILGNPTPISINAKGTIKTDADPELDLDLVVKVTAMGLDIEINAAGSR